MKASQKAISSAKKQIRESKKAEKATRQDVRDAKKDVKASQKELKNATQVEQNLQEVREAVGEAENKTAETSEAAPVFRPQVCPKEWTCGRIVYLFIGKILGVVDFFRVFIRKGGTERPFLCYICEDADR